MIKTLGRGGAERLVVQQLSTSTHEVEYSVVAVRGSGAELASEIEALGVPVTVLGDDGRSRFLWPIRLRRVIARERPDVVHVHSPAVASVLRPMLRTLRRRPRLVVTHHNVTYAHVLTRVADRMTRRLDDASIAVSDTVASACPPTSRQLARVIVHGVDVEHIRRLRRSRIETRRDLGLEDGEILVVSVANLRPGKDYPTLVRAAAAVCWSEPNVRFVAVGDGPLRAEIFETVRAHGLDERFVLLGAVPDAARYSAAADVFVLASAWEGLPVAIMEALVAGVPVVATDVGGVPQLIDDGGNGRLVAPGDPHELAERITELVRDPMQRARLAREAGGSCETLDAGRATWRIEALYRELVATR